MLNRIKSKLMLTIIHTRNKIRSFITDLCKLQTSISELYENSNDELRGMIIRDISKLDDIRQQIRSLELNNIPLGKEVYRD